MHRALGHKDDKLHEASLVEGLLKLAFHSLDQYCATNPDKAKPKIKEIICEAGLLACFEDRTLQACFEILAENTPAAGAKLIINTLPLDCICESCGRKFQLRKRNFVCPACKSDQIIFKGGNGLVLKAINVED